MALPALFVVVVAICRRDLAMTDGMAWIHGQVHATPPAATALPIS
jgi:hypothetical protein